MQQWRQDLSATEKRARRKLSEELETDYLGLRLYVSGLQHFWDEHPSPAEQGPQRLAALSVMLDHWQEDFPFLAVEQGHHESGGLADPVILRHVPDGKRIAISLNAEVGYDLLIQTAEDHIVLDHKGITILGLSFKIIAMFYDTDGLESKHSYLLQRRAQNWPDPVALK